jgi:tetratricopeptide (TPR) repeat protein
MIAGGVFLVLLSGLQAFGQGDVTLRGEVRTKEGEVIPFGVNISLDTSEGMPVGTRMADTAGNFVFEALQPGTYSMTITADKYQPYQQTLDMSFRGTTYMFKIFLSPLDKTQVKADALPARSDEAAPKLARKEFEKGDRALHDKKMPEARRHLERALAEYSCYARAQEALAQVDLAERKLPDAEENFKKAIQCDNTFLDSFSELAQLYLVEKKLPDSEAIINQGLRLSPKAWLLRYQLGAVHYGMGKYPEALQDYLSAQSFHSEMPAEFHVKIANVYLKTGDYSKALAEMDTYLRLDPNGGYARSARKLAETMRKDGVKEASTPATDAKP